MATTNSTWNVSFQEAGFYTIKLVVEDDDGASSTMYKEIEIKKPHEEDIDIISPLMIGLLAILTFFITLLIIKRSASGEDEEEMDRSKHDTGENEGGDVLGYPIWSEGYGDHNEVDGQNIEDEE